MLLALELLAHGFLLMTMQEWDASRSAVRILEARIAAESAVFEVVGTLPSTTVLELPVWGTAPETSGSAAGASYRGRLRRLSREYWVAEGWGRGRGTMWEAREGRLLWALDPAARIGSFSGVVEVVGAGPRVVGGRVDGVFVREDCGEWTAALDSVLGGWLPPVSSAPPVGPGGPAFGRLSIEAILAEIPVRVSGVGHPGPADRDGVCVVDEPWNWGDPQSPPGPCSAHLPSRGAVGDLRVEGGAGQGLLVVAGDLELVGVTFRGLVVASGEVRLGAGARVHGLIQSGAGLVVEAGSRVTGSACAALQALASSPPSLRSLHLVRSRGWLPFF